VKRLTHSQHNTTLKCVCVCLCLFVCVCRSEISCCLQQQETLQCFVAVDVPCLWLRVFFCLPVLLLVCRKTRVSLPSTNCFGFPLDFWCVRCALLPRSPSPLSKLLFFVLLTTSCCCCLSHTKNNGFAWICLGFVHFYTCCRHIVCAPLQYNHTKLSFVAKFVLAWFVLTCVCVCENHYSESAYMDLFVCLLACEQILCDRVNSTASQQTNFE